MNFDTHGNVEDLKPGIHVQNLFKNIEISILDDTRWHSSGIT